MVECKEISDKLYEYVDGDISSLFKNLVEQHLPTCEKCRNELNEIKGLYNLYKGHVVAEPSPDSFETFLKRREREKPHVIMTSEREYSACYLDTPKKAISTKKRLKLRKKLINKQRARKKRA